ncbi:MAG: 4Fe-4S dicluster domain-containing protein [Gemmatimonadetes bacterium]|jgi:2-oxoglutarate ferredoxin oxidoreductase subunit delta|nr:4Fe-4S dicluster domain-containing protein [Gemmatimonadota bacterium]
MAKNKGIYRVHIDPQLCKGTEGCGICVDLCRAKVLAPAPTLSARGVHPAEIVELKECTGCDLCMLYCPDLAIAVEHIESSHHA